MQVTKTSGVKLASILDMGLLQQHITNGLVAVQYHPSLDLRIYNYTHKAQYEAPWGDGTIDLCRGLIVDDEDNVIARPFRKFHNLNTAGIPETLEENLPAVIPVVTEKLDGSLGIFYEYEGQWGIATRGSFTSPQATWATQWYKKNNIGRQWPDGYTPLFEIIYDDNRIVCKYDYEGLTLLGLVQIRTGLEMGDSTAYSFARVNNVSCVQRHRFTDIATIKAENTKGREGYVLTFPRVKVKVKFEDYCRLHRIVTGMSPKAIWEMLSKGESLENLEEMPEHFKQWALSWRNKLVGKYNAIYNEAERVLADMPVPLVSADNRDPKVFRKAAAEFFIEKAPHLQSVLFAMLDKKNPSDVIWKMIKPRGDDKSFRADGE